MLCEKIRKYLEIKGVWEEFRGKFYGIYKVIFNY